MSSICEEKNYTKIHNQHSRRLRNFLYYRYGSLEKAFTYIGLYVEINEDSVSDCVDTTKDAPDSDFIMLMFMVFVLPFLIVLVGAFK